MEPQTKDRMAKNEALFRDVNERIREINEREAAGGGAADLWQFLCECGRRDCTTPISLTLAEYERVRSSPVAFAVSPGHEEPAVAQVLERSDRFVVVEKVPEQSGVALQTDPRA